QSARKMPLDTGIHSSARECLADKLPFVPEPRPRRPTLPTRQELRERTPQRAARLRVSATLCALRPWSTAALRVHRFPFQLFRSKLMPAAPPLSDRLRQTPPARLPRPSGAAPNSARPSARVLP